MKDTSKFDALTIEDSKRGDGVDVYGHTTYEDYSVLAGQPKKCYLEHFDTFEEAKGAYPDAEHSHPFLRQQASMPLSSPSWFDPLDTGEAWSEDDY